MVSGNERQIQQDVDAQWHQIHLRHMSFDNNTTDCRSLAVEEDIDV